MTDVDDMFWPEPCAGHVNIPGARPRPVSWSPAFATWLCEDCRGARTRAVLTATEKANEAAVAEAQMMAALADRPGGGG